MKLFKELEFKLKRIIAPIYRNL